MGTTTATAAEIPLPKPEGLEGVVAASTALSHVFGEEGRLIYRGYDIHELAGKASFEEVAHLLWIGHLPDRAELDVFNARLDANRELPPAVLEVIRALPRETPPMDVLRTAVSAVGPTMPELFDLEHPANLDAAIALSARFPSILAAFHRIRQGLEPISTGRVTTPRRAISISSSGKNRRNATGNRLRPISFSWRTTV